MRLIFWFFLVATTCSFGCGTVDAGSCTSTMAAGVVSCLDFTKGYTPDSAKQTCSSASGVYVTTACPTANRVSRCTVSTPDGAVMHVANYYSPTTADQAHAGCELLASKIH